MLRTYVPILLFILMATGFAVFTLLFSRLINAEKPGTVKLQPYECGIEPLSDPRDRYSVRYYLIAMLFVIFEIETVFMFPWAVSLGRLAIFGLVEMLVFLFVLIVGYAYAWRKGALEWQ
jgi:NADH-quinone oxidoreductase subunit A